MRNSSIRIIAGKFKGRKIPTFPDRAIRPTSQRAREALFSILGSDIQKAAVLDVFAGTGAVGLEALSRGAAKVFFVEHNPEAGASIQHVLSEFRISEAAHVLIEGASLAFQNSILLGWRPFDVMFMDPPYRFGDMKQLLHQCTESDLMAPHGRIIYEHFHKTTPPRAIGEWRLTRTVRYGDTAMSFFDFLPPSSQGCEL